MGGVGQRNPMFVYVGRAPETRPMKWSPVPAASGKKFLDHLVVVSSPSTIALLIRVRVLINNPPAPRFSCLSELPICPAVDPRRPVALSLPVISLGWS